MTCLQMHTVMTIRSTADVSSKTPKATNPRISSIGERLSPTSLEVGRVVGELEGTGRIKLCDASCLVVAVDDFCEGPGSIAIVCSPIVVLLGAIS